MLADLGRPIPRTLVVNPIKNGPNIKDAARIFVGDQKPPQIVAIFDPLNIPADLAGQRERVAQELNFPLRRRKEAA